MKKHYGTKTTEVTCLFVLQCHLVSFVKRNFRNKLITYSLPKALIFHDFIGLLCTLISPLIFFSILEHWILIGLVFVIIIVYSSWNKIRNWCQYTVQKTVSCQTQNGTETVVQRLFQSCRWPGPCSNLIRYREKKLCSCYSLSH